MENITPGVVYAGVFVATIFILRFVINFLPKNFNSPNKISTGLRIHHLHYGIVISLLSTLVLLAFRDSVWPWAFVSFGQALIFDEFYPSKSLPQVEPATSKIYYQSRYITQAYAVIIALAAIAISLSSF